MNKEKQRMKIDEDYNAMQEALKKLTPLQQESFCGKLVILTKWDRANDNVFAIATATCEQLAEAFLFAIGQWEKEAINE